MTTAPHPTGTALDQLADVLASHGIDHWTDPDAHGFPARVTIPAGPDTIVVEPTACLIDPYRVTRFTGPTGADASDHWTGPLPAVVTYARNHAVPARTTAPTATAAAAAAWSLNPTPAAEAALRAANAAVPHTHTTGRHKAPSTRLTPRGEAAAALVGGLALIGTVAVAAHALAGIR